MKLAIKLSLAFTMVTVLVLGVHMAVRIERETTLFERDLARDHRAMADILSSVIALVWRVEGRARAMELVQRMDSERAHVKISWMPLDLIDRDEPAGPLAPHQWDTLTRDRLLVQQPLRVGRDEHLVTYRPVVTGDTLAGLLTLSESLAQRQAYVWTSIRNTLIALAALVALNALASLALGVRLIGRPVQTLVAQARCVGQGIFSAGVISRRNDELGILAREMNQMIARLAELRGRLEQEQAARLELDRQLQHADRLQTIGVLASAVAHELGTPLNVVAARAKMIASREVTGDAACDNAATIGQQAARMADIIREILSFARTQRPRRAPADLTELVGHAAALVAPLAQRRGVALRQRQAQALTPLVVDAVQLQQALVNLLVNAIQASPAGGAIEVDLAHAAGGPDGAGAERWLRVDVRDGGTGIAPQDLPRIFEPFFTTKASQGGTGLGLAISRRIIEDHGGRIAVQSSAGQGSTFTLWLPAEPGDTLARPTAAATPTPGHPTER